MENQEQYKYLNDLLETENTQLRKLNQIVADSIREQDLITHVVAEKSPEALSIGQKLADKVAKFGGSWRFIICFGAFMLLWIVANVVVLTQKPFDPYPFILLNLILSCLAAIQAPVIMMSQNRKEEKDRKRAENDYLVNLKAEIEIRNLHKKVDLLILDQMKTLIDIQKVQVEMIQQIQEKLNK